MWLFRLPGTGGGVRDGNKMPMTCECPVVLDPEVEVQAWNELTDCSTVLLRSQLDRLADVSGFYRDKWRNAGVDARSVRHVDELAALPFTTKQEIRTSQDAHPPFGAHLAAPEEDVRVVYQTSGTSGNPSVIALSEADIQTWRSIGARSYYTTGIHDHSAVLTTFGAGPFVAGHTHGVLERLGVRRIPIGPGDTERLLSAAKRGIADTLLSTPTFAMHIATVCHERGIDARSLGIRRIVTGGEPGGGIPSIRRSLEESFGAVVNEAMGLGDISASLFGECGAQDGMHFSGQGFVWFELVDAESGEPLPLEDGAVGEPVYTCLVREAMPLVRFRSGDLVEIRTRPCGCPRTSFRMVARGRVDDMFIVRGVNVYPSAIQAVVAEFRPQVTGRCRVLLPRGVGISVPAPVRIEVEAQDPPDATALAEQIQREVRSRLVFQSHVTFVAPADFGDAGYKTVPVVTR